MEFQGLINPAHRNSIQDIHNRAYKDALYQFYKTAYLHQMIGKFQDTGEVPEMPSDPKMLQLIDDYRDRFSTKPPYMLLTVNTQEGISYNKLKTKVEKYVHSNIVQEYIYCYEVRTSDGEGLHCHILFRYRGKPADIRRSTKNTFKSVCNSDNPHCLNFKFVTEELLSAKIDYILGIKSEKKQKSVTMIKEWRDTSGIPHYHESNPPFPCRVALITDESHRSGALASSHTQSPATSPRVSGAEDGDETKDDSPTN